MYLCPDPGATCRHLPQASHSTEPCFVDSKARSFFLTFPPAAPLCSEGTLLLGGSEYLIMDVPPTGLWLSSLSGHSQSRSRQSDRQKGQQRWDSCLPLSFLQVCHGTLTWNSTLAACITVISFWTQLPQTGSLLSGLRFSHQLHCLENSTLSTVGQC